MAEVLNSVDGWTPEINEYLKKIGPKVGRPDRPRKCLVCPCEWIWFDGWRFVYCVILIDQTVKRFENGLPLQRVACSECNHSWTLRPYFIYPHREFEPEVTEAAAMAYLSEVDATYKKIGNRYQCSPRSVWRWVGWIGRALSAPSLIAEAEREGGTGAVVQSIPKRVPQDHRKAYSDARAQLLLDAFQALSALVILKRSYRIPPSDPSALRFWLIGEFRAFRFVYRLNGKIRSPPMPVVIS